MTVFLDCDGVLADFDRGAKRVLGMAPRVFEDQFGSQTFWSKLEAHPRFYADLDLMPDASDLVAGVARFSPRILTGCPSGGWAESQKLEWAARHFPGIPMITCKSRGKNQYASSGDILIDDWPQYMEEWQSVGGIFILHRSATESLAALRNAMAP